MFKEMKKKTFKIHTEEKHNILNFLIDNEEFNLLIQKKCPTNLNSIVTN